MAIYIGNKRMSSGFKGATGANGIPGPQGEPGPQGPPGPAAQGGIIAQTTAPGVEQQKPGILWLDTSNTTHAILKYWNGSAWVSVGAAGVFG